MSLQHHPPPGQGPFLYANNTFSSWGFRDKPDIVDELTFIDRLLVTLTNLIHDEESFDSSEKRFLKLCTQLSYHEDNTINLERIGLIGQAIYGAGVFFGIYASLPLSTDHMRFLNASPCATRWSKFVIDYMAAFHTFGTNISSILFTASRFAPESAYGVGELYPLLNVAQNVLVNVKWNTDAKKPSVLQPQPAYAPNVKVSSQSYADVKRESAKFSMVAGYDQDDSLVARIVLISHVLARHISPLVQGLHLRHATEYEQAFEVSDEFSTGALTQKDAESVAYIVKCSFMQIDNALTESVLRGTPLALEFVVEILLKAGAIEFVFSESFYRRYLTHSSLQACESDSSDALSTQRKTIALRFSDLLFKHYFWEHLSVDQKLYRCTTLLLLLHGSFVHEQFFEISVFQFFKAASDNLRAALHASMACSHTPDGASKSAQPLSDSPKDTLLSKELMRGLFCDVFNRVFAPLTDVPSARTRLLTLWQRHFSMESYNRAKQSVEPSSDTPVTKYSDVPFFSEVSAMLLAKKGQESFDATVLDQSCGDEDSDEVRKEEAVICSKEGALVRIYTSFEKDAAVLRVFLRALSDFKESCMTIVYKSHATARKDLAGKAALLGSSSAQEEGNLVRALHGYLLINSLLELKVPDVAEALLHQLFGVDVDFSPQKEAARDNDSEPLSRCHLLFILRKMKSLTDMLLFYALRRHILIRSDLRLMLIDYFMGTHEKVSQAVRREINSLLAALLPLCILDSGFAAGLLSLIENRLAMNKQMHEGIDAILDSAASSSPHQPQHQSPRSPRTNDAVLEEQQGVTEKLIRFLAQHIVPCLFLAEHGSQSMARIYNVILPSLSSTHRRTLWLLLHQTSMPPGGTVHHECLHKSRLVSFFRAAVHEYLHLPLANASNVHIFGYHYQRTLGVASLMLVPELLEILRLSELSNIVFYVSCCLPDYFAEAFFYSILDTLKSEVLDDLHRLRQSYTLPFAQKPLSEDGDLQAVCKAAIGSFSGTLNQISTTKGTVKSWVLKMIAVACKFLFMRLHPQADPSCLEKSASIPEPPGCTYAARFFDNSFEYAADALVTDSARCIAEGSYTHVLLLKELFGLCGILLTGTDERIGIFAPGDVVEAYRYVFGMARCRRDKDVGSHVHNDGESMLANHDIMSALRLSLAEEKTAGEHSVPCKTLGPPSLSLLRGVTRVFVSRGVRNWLFDHLCPRLILPFLPIKRFLADAFIDSILTARGDVFNFSVLCEQMDPSVSREADRPLDASVAPSSNHDACLGEAFHSDVVGGCLSPKLLLSAAFSGADMLSLKCHIARALPTTCGAGNPLIDCIMRYWAYIMCLPISGTSGIPVTDAVGSFLTALRDSKGCASDNESIDVLLNHTIGTSVFHMPTCLDERVASLLCGCVDALADSEHGCHGVFRLLLALTKMLAVTTVETPRQTTNRAANITSILLRYMSAHATAYSEYVLAYFAVSLVAGATSLLSQSSFIFLTGIADTFYATFKPGFAFLMLMLQKLLNADSAGYHRAFVSAHWHLLETESVEQPAERLRSILLNKELTSILDEETLVAAVNRTLDSSI